uniref:hypothetical protein n=1 Tax=Jeotgalibaca porci TaxID=1868793 RepID=UPI0035A16886
NPSCGKSDIRVANSARQKVGCVTRKSQSAPESDGLQSRIRALGNFVWRVPGADECAVSVEVGMPEMRNG